MTQTQAGIKYLSVQANEGEYNYYIQEFITLSNTDVP